MTVPYTEEQLKEWDRETLIAELQACDRAIMDGREAWASSSEALKGSEEARLASERKLADFMQLAEKTKNDYTKSFEDLRDSFQKQLVENAEQITAYWSERCSVAESKLAVYQQVGPMKVSLTIESQETELRHRAVQLHHELEDLKNKLKAINLAASGQTSKVKDIQQGHPLWTETFQAIIGIWEAARMNVFLSNQYRKAVSKFMEPENLARLDFECSTQALGESGVALVNWPVSWDDMEEDDREKSMKAMVILAQRFRDTVDTDEGVINAPIVQEMLNQGDSLTAALERLAYLELELGQVHVRVKPGNKF